MAQVSSVIKSLWSKNGYKNKEYLNQNVMIADLYLFLCGWNREKYDASQTDNPIRDALNEKGLHSLPYNVDGHTILDTLCPNTIQVIEGRTHSLFNNLVLYPFWNSF